MTGPAFEKLVDALTAGGQKVIRKGSVASARCPAHDDGTPSLSLRAIEGTVLVKCWGGCATEDVLAALGLSWADLYDDPKGARYDYLNATGTRRVRTVTRTPDKQFRQRVTEKGTVSLFRLPQVIAAVAAGRPIYLVEGEKDVLALESIGLVATTAPMGAINFSKADVSPLAGAQVIAIVDKDEAGRAWAAQVADALRPVAQELSFKEAASGKDAADHIAAGLGVTALVDVSTNEEERSMSGADDSAQFPGTKEEERSMSGPGLPVRDPAMFHGLLGDLVTTADPYTEADRVGVLVSLMAGVGVLLDERPHVMIGNTRHPLLVWPLLFGLTGSGRKGEAASAARQFLRAADPAFDEVSVTGLSSGEGLIERIKDPVEEDPDSKRRPADWPGTLDKRLMVTEPEFASVMARAKREGNTLAGVLRESWDGGRLGVLTKAHVRASSSHIAIAGHITPKEFRLRLVESDLAGGTYNRFLPVYVERSKRLPLPDPVPDHVLEDAARRLREALHRGRMIGRITLGADASKLWASTLYDEFAGDDDEDAAWSQFARRAAPYCLRIAALHACTAGRAQISGDDLLAAAALVRYSIGSAQHVLARTASDPRLDRVRRAIDEAPVGYVTKSDVSALFGRNQKANVLEELLDRVIASGAYQRIEVPTKGRPATAFARSDFVLSSSFVPRTDEKPCLVCGQMLHPTIAAEGAETCPNCDLVEAAATTRRTTAA